MRIKRAARKKNGLEVQQNKFIPISGTTLNAVNVSDSEKVSDQATDSNNDNPLL